jgi:hypothetical protein
MNDFEYVFPLTDGKIDIKLIPIWEKDITGEDLSRSGILIGFLYDYMQFMEFGEDVYPETHWFYIGVGLFRIRIRIIYNVPEGKNDIS